MQIVVQSSLQFALYTHSCMRPFASDLGLSIFRQNAEWHSALCHDLSHLSLTSSFVIHHKVSVLDSLRTVWPWITKLYTDICTDLVYSHIRCDVTGCFQLAAKCNWMLHKKCVKRVGPAKNRIIWLWSPTNDTECLQRFPSWVAWRFACFLVLSR